MMAVVDWHDCNWEASGWARRFSLVCFSYDFIAAWKRAWKREEADVVAAVRDIMGVCCLWKNCEVLREDD